MWFNLFKKSFQESGRRLSFYIIFPVIFFCPPAVGEKWMSDERTPKDVCGEASWPVDNLHLGRFNCDMFLGLRPDKLNLSRNKLQR